MAESQPTQIASFGAGDNSTAMVIGMVQRDEPIHHILFSDPGAERPGTYHHIETFSAWLVSRGYPAIKTIRRAPAIVGNSTAATLEEECLMRGQLPGIAYGFKSCSDKWKMQPFRTWLKEQDFEKAVVFIGYDANETRRAAKGDEYSQGYLKRYPLIEWGWDRDKCVAQIIAAGISPPGKSACFFCPSSRKHEILALSREHPDLMARALRMEAGANLTNIKGLGRRFAWADLVTADEGQDKLFPDVNVDVPCGCFDGGAD